MVMPKVLKWHWPGMLLAVRLSATEDNLKWASVGLRAS
jgi:hypothetical protein